MNNGLIAKRYAKGFYLTSKDDVRLSLRLGRELKLFRDLYINEGFDKILNNPAFLLSERIWVIDTIGRHFDFHEYTTNLLKLLEKRGRMPLVDDILRAYRIILDKGSGQKMANVITDEELPYDVFAKFRKKFEQVLGDNVFFHKAQRPKEVGVGVRIQLEGRVIDASIEGMLSRLLSRLGIPKGG